MLTCAQSTFQALNIDYDQVTADQEVDDTKELQIEEALKLYQTALKHHASGSSSYDLARTAYAELLASDIFKYPEAQSELARGDAFPEYEEMWIENVPVQAVVTSVEQAPNTLSQLVYLSYKNYGRFLLDLLQWTVQEKVRERERDGQQETTLQREVQEAARKPLGAYAEALDKDDTDIELWRSSAAVAQLVGCNRIARFCLEAVLDMGEESLDDILGLPNVEQTLSLLKLQDMVTSLQDDVSKALAPLSMKRKQKLGEALIKRLESHAAVPKPAFTETAYSQTGHHGVQPPLRMRMAPNRDWIAVGEVIIDQQLKIELAKDNLPPPPYLVHSANGPHQDDDKPGLGVAFEFPDGMVDDTETAAPVVALPERPLGTQKGQQAAVSEPSAAQAGATETTEAQKVEAPSKESEDATQPETTEQAAGAPSRKRSPESAELPEDDNRVRSKRMRSRGDTAADASNAKPDEAKINADWQLGIYRDSDGWLNDAANVFLSKLALPELISAPDLRALVSGEGNMDKLSGEQLLKSVVREVYEITTSCPPEMVGILDRGLNNENIDSFGNASKEAGLNAFLGNSPGRGAQAKGRPMLGPAEGLAVWIEEVNGRWHYPKEAAWKFLTAFLKPGAFPRSQLGDESSYVKHSWHEDLKRTIVQIAVRFDDHIYRIVEDEITEMSARHLHATSHGTEFAPEQEDMNTVELVQTLFELHLDVYSLIKRPGVNVDDGTRDMQKNKLERWSALANIAVNLRVSSENEQRTDDLTLRHIWATAFHISVCDDVEQSHVLACMKDLKSLLLELDEPVLSLQNNAIMPEISMAAIEQELSKINMKDFFAKIFSDREEDPYETIVSLEPLLEGSIQTPAAESPSGQLLREAGADDAGNDPTPQEQMSKFLANSTWTLRLSLWQRLRQAYVAIQYPPKVVSCHLRSIELLVKEMITGASGTTGEARKLELMRWLHLIAEFAHKLLYLQVSCTDMFDCVDFEHLRASIAAVTQVLQMLHSFNLYEDQVRVNAIPPPTFEGKPKPSFTQAAKWMHNLQIRLWMLLYRMFQEAIEQDPEAFESPTEIKMEYLRTLHYALGQRKICNEANRELLHLLLDETLALSDSEYSEQELAQVVLDLYNLKFAAKPEDELMDHGCSEHSEVLTRKAAQKLLGFFMAQAQKVPMKDMPKHDIKGAVDKVQGALGKGKSTDDMVLNNRVFSAFMKGPINPLDLFACLRGTFDIPTKPIPDADAPVAAKGWQFLLGMIALNKFKSTKRLASGPCEDLNTAQAFFRQDIEYCSDHWESWYRLAQVNDLQLEEHVSWSAEKLNSHSHEVFHYQRNALHAYIMATTSAVRCADQSPKTLALVAEMYADFGNRIFASSRDPFSMLAFGFQDREERHFSGQIVYQRPPFNPLQLFTAWRLASVLFKRSLARAPETWLTHYMLGKCLWKMYTFQFPEGSTDLKYRPAKQEVIDCFVKAITKLPKRDSRKEPILEPHYKLVAIIHKLFKRGDLTRPEAQDLLKTSSYAARVAVNKEDTDSWSEYVSRILKSLRSADKAGWHHRMTARAAHLLYDDTPTSLVSAMEAKAELTQQMFTKTMVLQVWKPEFERPGRHFVYTTRYVQFFVQLLSQLNDRESLNALVKRLRRKPDQYFDHARLWLETCISYLRLLRKTGAVPESYEDAVFKSLNHEDFTTRSAKLEAWCHSSRSDGNLTYSVLCDVIELKKTNNGLMKATLIDDLLGDTYAKLYEEIGPDQLSHVVLPKAEGSTPAPPPLPQAAPHKPMSLTSVMNMDGATDATSRSFSPAQPEQQPTTQPKPRIKLGVGRREIQRKAESASSKPISATAATPSRTLSISATPTGSQLVSVVIPSPRPSLTKAPSAGTLEAVTSTPLPTNPYAVQDSSDESELTELEEEPEEPSQYARPGSLGRFLGLRDSPADSSVTAREGGEGDEGEGDGEDEGDEEEQEEEEGEGEGEEEGLEDGNEEDDGKDGEGDAKMED
jgi:hypothetical protein